MDLTADRLVELSLDAAEVQPAELPAGLERRVVAGSLGGSRPLRHPGWLNGDRRQLTSLAAFIKTAAEVADLIGTLGVNEWDCMTRVDRATVRDIVRHLFGVERYLLGQLGRRPPLEAPRREDHWAVTTLAADDELGDEQSPSLAQSWWSELLRVIAACGELGPDYEITFHHLAGSLEGLLVLRTFELWTHGDDIRQATQRPLDLLDDPRMSLMIDQLMRVLPLGLALAGCPQPGRTARFNLSGPGGGSFDVALSPQTPVGAPNVTIFAGALDLCRLAANRLGPHRLDVTVEGDGSLLESILVGATAFASD